MAVPKTSQLRPGVGVNIVLKADQRSGRLTGGSISEVAFAFFVQFYELEAISQEQRLLLHFQAALVAQSSLQKSGADSLQILTRGDHPRGIKVRLTNGQIGRVQSLSTASRSSSSFGNAGHPPPRVSSETYDTDCGRSQSQSKGRSSGRRGGYTLQDDYRQDPTPLESRSLADYIRPSSAQMPASFEEPPLQSQMESEFPKLDSALIAAIVADYSDPVEARNVLSALS